MTTTNIAVAGLESYQPAVDYKRSNKVGILSGRNFAWDASGVYSAYASRLVSGTTSIGLPPIIVQTLDLEDLSHVGCFDKVWRMNPTTPASPVGTWELITTLTPLINADINLIPYDFRKWSTAYLGGNRYACSYNFGVFRVVDGNPPTYTRLTSGTVAGFPSDATPVIAIAETNGRMLYLTETSFIWSGAAAPEDLSPAIGGAGFQVIAERIGGTPFALTPVSTGAIIWTTVGALVAEFVGGPTVFRFYQLSTNALPISSFAITRMPDDDYVILTRLGLFMFNNLSQPQPITPLFNEFLREYLRNHSTEKGHIWYSINDNRIYVAFRPTRSAFSETFALEVVLDRWGVFSESHMGLFSYGLDRGQIAYANNRGICSYLLSSLDPRKDKEDASNPGTMLGLNSSVTLGWLRAEALVNHADVTQELQEVIVNRAQPFGTVTLTYFDEEYVIDDTVPNIPFNLFVDEGLVTGTEDTVIDEGLITEQDVVIDYDLTWVSDLFSDETLRRFTPSLAKQLPYSDLWTGLQPAVYHRLRFDAIEHGKYFRVNSLDMTVTYYGNIS